jgi:uncharacterized coiled-coil protein SlyX
VKPLGEIDEAIFPAARARVEDFGKVLQDKTINDFGRQLVESQKAGKQAKEQLQNLIDRLRKVTDEMQGLIDLKKLIEKARDIEAKEKAQRDFLDKVKERLLKDIFGGDDTPKSKEK